MNEPTHAIEHHMRIAADRAVRSQLGNSFWPIGELEDANGEGGQLLKRWADNDIHSAGMLEGKGGREEAARYLEQAAGKLLRLAVWLRRTQ